MTLGEDSCCHYLRGDAAVNWGGLEEALDCAETCVGSDIRGHRSCQDVLPLEVACAGEVWT